ncbi:maleylpyruvate isomerase family mycothiol-dependent enzyme [Sediminivirga luteola]|nr:maleylpyruvate isomerase family mycothiol-dependent enzyme [Sediminivirga luteola]MCI2265695.1 maleylpyruvate isomerase family mycothiol-dependent enzyme [Sediminivirga luteola]
MTFTTTAAVQNRWPEALTAATGEFAGVLGTAGTAGLAAPVAACPGWTLRELAGHLGEVHGWAAHIVDGGDPRDNPVERPESRDAPALGTWYARQAENLLTALTEAGADRECWTMAPPRTTQFWWRRQVHETLVHLWDARTALDLPAPLDPQLAWDGVAEVAEVFYPRQLRRERLRPLPQSLVLRPSDLRGDPVVLGEGDMIEVTGPAGVLLLLLWHRISWADALRAGAQGTSRAAELLALPLVP